MSWPEYCYISKCANGKWRGEVQNNRGENAILEFVDPMMAEAWALKKRELLGVEEELSVFHNNYPGGKRREK